MTENQLKIMLMESYRQGCIDTQDVISTMIKSMDEEIDELKKLKEGK